MKKIFCLTLLVIGNLAWTGGPRCVVAQDAPAVAPETATQEPDSRGQSTAVALNYCRASFHRIGRIQSKRVLIEEKEKILNNLNLNGIADEEVIKLYSAVLDEISQIEVTETEVSVLKDKYKKAVHRQIGQTTFLMAAQFATASMDSMARTGVNSWLDYRDLSWTREFDQWKVEKARIQAVVDKSSKFLDTFWKLAQKKNIPDRWMIRGNDLDNLAEAIAEEDLERRLRVLNRMEPFMECFPPYWYYLARTQQGLGKFDEAAKTYDKLADLAAGHFRKDDMLAAAIANRAIIQENLKQAGADRSALEALRYSSAVWEANLMCAQVLERHELIDDAEDAILRNLDVGLEVPRSATSLLGLYYRQGRSHDIARTLNNDEWLPQIPVISLIQAAKKLPSGKLPPKLVERIQQTIGLTVDRNFGADDLLLICDPVWQANEAQIRIQMPHEIAGSSIANRTVSPSDPESKGQLQQLASGETLVRFKRITERGNLFSQRSASLLGTTVEFSYLPKNSNVPLLAVTFGPPVRRTDTRSTWWPAASPVSIQFEDTTIDLIQTTLVVASRPNDSASVSEPSPNSPPSSEKIDWQTASKAPVAGSNSKPDVLREAADTNRNSPPKNETKPSDVVPSSQPRPAIAVLDRQIPRVTILGVRSIEETHTKSDPDADSIVPPPPE